MPARKRPEKSAPTPPEKDVREMQDADQTVADFLRDLDRATTDKSKERVESADDT
jgi:hypothetical protein